MDKEILYVVKIGGNIIDDELRLSDFLKKFAALKGKKILVHGGGRLATRMAENLNIPQQMVEGRRITDLETLKIVTMVYGGYINKRIVAELQSVNCNSMGVCGADGNLILAEKRKNAAIDYGYVGDVRSVNTELFSTLLHSDLAIIVAPLTHDMNGQILNTNADTIAQEIGRALSMAFYVELIYSFEKAGVLTDINDESTVIPEINANTYAELKSSGRIFAGMIPKLDNAFSAIHSGVKRVIIGKAEELELLTAHKSGTSIVA